MRRVQKLLLGWYRRSGRAQLPWRGTRDPYRILVAEFMLQQTQVDRVLPKYAAFIERFADFRSLAQAATADVLRMWQGLGYNSRAVRLKQIAQEIVQRFDAKVPRDAVTLRSLPGIGPYTATALRAFAFEIDGAAVDTNVRRVVHRLQYGLEHPPAVSPARLDGAAGDLVPPGYAHDWNSAMMDLGATICTARAPKCLLCPLRTCCAAAPVDSANLEAARLRHARKRSPQAALPFEQTTRFVRGRVIDKLRALPPGRRISMLDLRRELSGKADRSEQEFADIVRALERDGLIERHGQEVGLRDERQVALQSDQ